jgi:hypothetical protein
MKDIAAELRALEKAAQQDNAARGARRNRRYVTSISFTTPTTNIGPYANPSVAKSSSISIGDPFYCASLECCMRVIGSATTDGGGVDVFDVPLTVFDQGVLPLSSSIGIFDFFWSIRDSFADREWTKGKQPSAMLETTAFGPLHLPRRQFLPAGTEVTVEIEPLYAVIEPLVGEGVDVVIRSVSVEFCLVGYEV